MRLLSIKPNVKMKKMKHTLILIFIVVSGQLFANGEILNDSNAAMKIWEATPEGIKFKKWELSPAGKKVYASEAKIRKSLREFTKIEAEVTSLSLPAGSRLGFGVMIRIKGDDYILSFGPNLNNEFEQLKRLKVNDRISIKSHGVSHAPKYAYPIIGGDYVERGSEILYKRKPRKGGC